MKQKKYECYYCGNKFTFDNIICFSEIVIADGVERILPKFKCKDCN